MRGTAHETPCAQDDGIVAQGRAGVVSEWRDIRTAPRDGTVILVWAEFQPSGNKRRAYSPASAARWESFFGGYWASTPSDHRLKATLWMPIPEPPSSYPTPSDEDRLYGTQCREDGDG